MNKEDLLIALVSMAVLFGAAWATWMMYELVWAFRCAFGV